MSMFFGSAPAEARGGSNLLAGQAGMNSMDTKLALSNEANMEITGDDQQILTIKLGESEEILVQPGCMVWCDEGIQSTVSFGGTGNFCTRMCCLGQSGFRVHWVNESHEAQRIGLTPSFPAKVVPINLNDHSKSLFIKGGSFLAASDPNLSFEVERAGRQSGGTASKGVMGGQGFFLNKISGEGWVFLSAAGAIFQKYLAERETIVVDTFSVVAWESTVAFSYRWAGGMGMMCCGGEGLANTTLTGPGFIVVQSMPFEKVRMMLANNDGSNASGGNNPVAGLISCLVIIFMFVAYAAISVLQQSGQLGDVHS